MARCQHNQKPMPTTSCATKRRLACFPSSAAPLGRLPAEVDRSVSWLASRGVVGCALGAAWSTWVGCCPAWLSAPVGSNRLSSAVGQLDVRRGSSWRAVCDMYISPIGSDAYSVPPPVLALAAANVCLLLVMLQRRPVALQAISAGRETLMAGGWYQIVALHVAVLAW